MKTIKVTSRIKNMHRLNYLIKIVKTTALGFNEDNCFRFSAALSFYTLFSIAPMIMIAIYVGGLFVEDTTLRNEVYDQFGRLLGQEGAEGIRVLIETLQQEKQSMFSLIMSVGILIFSATNIFIQVQGAFNEIFKVTTREGKNILKLIRDRALSLGMILSLGFIMIISLILDALIVNFINQLESTFSALSISLATVAEYLVILIFMTLLIAALFRFLPDVRIYRKYLWRSAFITALLLILGKFGIGWYIGQSNLSELGGAASSVIILMLWVYYTSLILFIGAELIRAQLSLGHKEIVPKKFAVRVRSVKINPNESEA